jgi:hypothetical protein
MVNANMVNPESARSKLAKIARFLAQIARILASKNTVKYDCRFPLITPPTGAAQKILFHFNGLFVYFL